MPEIVTKHPETVLQILKGVKMNCGNGATQKILTDCPPEKFCQSPDANSEICVYHPSEIGQMTQMTSMEFIKGSDLFIPAVSLAIMIFVGGIMCGMAINRKAR